MVVLGAYVRLSAAGLGCPDWPGYCSHAAAACRPRVDALFPHAAPDLTRAPVAMSHRYAAGVLGLLVPLAAAHNAEPALLLPFLVTLDSMRWIRRGGGRGGRQAPVS